MKNTYVMLFLITIAGACNPGKKGIDITSPENKVKVEFLLTDDGRPQYVVRYADKLAVDTSLLGFELDGSHLDRNFKIVNTSNSSFDETWEQPWGEERQIRNNYNELKVELQEKKGLKRKMNIIFRVYDYGLGFRYEFPQQENLKEFEIMEEVTTFKFPENHQAWWTPAYASNRYEYLYQKNPINDLDYVHTPLTLETKDSLYISIHEAAIQEFSSLYLKGIGNNTLHCHLVPWSTTNNVRSYVEAPFATPWRTLQIAEKPGDLITSYLILNLNEPNKLGDVSWFKPGKYVGIWWDMHINTGTWHQGPIHGATTARTKKYIDFAAKHGFDGVLVEGWNYGWDGDWMTEGHKFDFTRPYPDYDIDELSRYAKEKGVYIVGHHETGADVDNYERQLDAAYAFLEKHGMKAVKTGYVEHGDTLPNGKYHHGQFYVNHFKKVIELAAKHKIAVVAHEPIKDSGERRTYPNIVSREGARGQEYNAWGGPGGNQPDHVTILPFTRMLSGPMDYTPGVFDIKIPTQPDNQIPHTLAKELALYVVIYSPMQMACDLPENYEGHPAFQFIKDVGVDWETTKVIDGKIGEFVTIARKERGSERWFLGGITNENERNYSIKLDFLDDKRYKATIYEDGKDAHYIHQPTSYTIREKEVGSDDTFQVNLAASGGIAIMFEPIN